MRKNYFLGVIALILVLYIAACTSTKTQARKDQATALRKLGEAYMTDKKDAAAYQKLTEAEKLNPKDPYTHFALGIFYFNKGKYDLSIEKYKKCLELKPDFASVRNNLGIAYMAKGDYDTAISHFNELTENYFYATPHYPLANMGQAYFHKNQYENAEKYLLQSLKILPRFTIALHWLGRTYVELGNPFKAIENLEKAISQAPLVPEIHFDLGEAYAMASQNEKAVHAYKKVIELAPDSQIGKRAESIVSMIDN